MQRGLFACAITIAITAAPTMTEAHGTEGDADNWRTKVDTTMDVRGFGYAPADIISMDGDVRVKGKELQQERGAFGFRLFIHGDYFHLEAFPYTVVPEPEDGGYKVSLAGIELYLLAVVRDWLRVGLYHHSAHNFSLEDHGRGIDLNAIVVDAEVSEGNIAFVTGGRYLLRTMLHYYATDKGSPYVFTEDTDIDASRIGNVKWRLMSEVGAYTDADMRGSCTVAVAATSSSIASFTSGCEILVSPGNQFLGVFGEHFFVGPYVRYGQNMQHVKRFGRNAMVGGIRMRLLFNESHEDLKYR